jgi:tetratricopeptide (TPR) repeat protein
MNTSETKCARPGCPNPGKNRCSDCLREPYCSGECQKYDWKFHKKVCKILKKLPNYLQPFREVVRVIKEIQASEIYYIRRILEHVLAYAEYQFGTRDPGQTYRERDGERVDNYFVEINILRCIFYDICNSFTDDRSLSILQEHDMTLPYEKKILDLLSPWCACLDSNEAIRKERLDEDEVRIIRYSLSNTERDLAIIYINRYQFDMAENHCQRALSYARQFEGEVEFKTTLLCDAFGTYADLWKRQGNFVKAMPFAEEAYNCVAEAYDPVHPKVQVSAGELIELLVHKGDFFNAERFAQLTLGSLKDPMNKLDQEGDMVARGYYDLANVIYLQQEDTMKAEMLAREALRIYVLLYGEDHFHTGLTTGLLANIFLKQDKLGDETKELSERSLAIDIRNFGPDGSNTSIGHSRLGHYHFKLARRSVTVEKRKKHRSLSIACYAEAQRISTKIFGADHPKTVTCTFKLTKSLELEEA